MFAYDTTESSVADTIDELIPKIQAAANKLHNWSALNGMIIHPGKTKTMIISKRKFIGPLQNIAMNGRNLEIVDHKKVLGTTIDDSLSWRVQIDKNEKHYRTKIKMLTRMVILGNVIMSKFYFATIIPSVTYNITVWGNNNVILKKLEIARTSC
eukprot:TCONS_00053739-protein